MTNEQRLNRIVKLREEANSHRKWAGCCPSIEYDADTENDEVVIKLTRDEYWQLMKELQSLWSYHWADNHVHGCEDALRLLRAIRYCGSKVQMTIEDQVSLQLTVPREV